MGLYFLMYCTVLKYMYRKYDDCCVEMQLKKQCTHFFVNCSCAIGGIMINFIMYIYIRLFDVGGL